ncbi:hypothetical protein WA026_014281 [Henosepilachna vigintioctopunctata]|uniref:MPN domain-containing protein n=1 Tax=Henosepilachna vigintioctopunctata TaxID=420089 RepID=A0AAW1TNC4_9CUCU
MVETDQNYLKRVILASDVYMICLQHALTTEKEEIMGLLLGEVDEKERISHISGAMILLRSDKQPDRVEISPELIYTATTYAEEISQRINKPIRVLGWYHSHPHITVWPSHVDVRTQSTYQMLDSLFVGLIFSVYHNDAGSSANHVQVTCFQAIKSGIDYERREIELVVGISPFEFHNLEGIVKLPKILFEEEINRHAEVGSGSRDELTLIHNNAIKTVELLHIVSQIAKPLCTDLEKRLLITKSRIKKLQRLKKKLQDKNLKVV